MINFDPNQSCFKSDNGLNTFRNQTSNNSQSQNQASQSRSLTSNFNSFSVNLIQVQVEDTNEIPSDSGNHQAEKQTSKNGSKLPNSEKKSEEPSFSEPTINKTLDALGTKQTDEQVHRDGRQDPNPETKPKEPSCSDPNYAINKIMNALGIKKTDGSTKENGLKNANPAGESEQPSCYKSIYNMNADNIQTSKASAGNEANIQAYGEQRTLGQGQVNERPNQRISIIPNKQSSFSVKAVVEVLEMLGGISQKNQQNETIVRYTFSDIPSHFSNAASNIERQRLEEILKNQFFEIIQNSKRIDGIQMKKLGEEKEEQKFSEKGALQEGDLVSALSGYELMEVMGGGAHGVVYIVRNEEGEIKAIKVYKKGHQKEFLREVGILSRLNINDMGGEVGIADTFEAKDHYGVVLKAGAGTLLDYKEFLKKEGLDLSENQLLCIFLQIYKNVIKYQNVCFAHRDIKPANIIIKISPQGLELEIIDYGLALPLYSTSKQFQVVGTPGYVDPYLLENHHNLTPQDFLLGDLFSLGITLLELAVPNFTPEQNNWEGLGEALPELVDRQPEILHLLSIFLDKDKYRNKTEEDLVQFLSKLEILIEDLERKISPSEGSLNEEWDLYCERFETYLADKFLRKKSQHEKLLQSEIEDEERLNHLRAIQFIKEGILVKKLVLDLTAVDQSLDYFIEKDDIPNQILCHENLLKYWIQTKDLTEVERSSCFLLKVVKRLRKSKLEGFPGLHFLFSTIGVAYYELSKMESNYELQNLEISCEMFGRGVAVADNQRDKKILLNNLACALSKIEYRDKQARRVFQKVYDLTEKEIESFSFKTLELWSNFNDSNVRRTDLFCIRSKNPHRSFEYILVADKTLPRSWRNPLDDQDPFYLSFVIFQNYCFGRNQNMLYTLLESEQGITLVENLRDISFSFNLQNTAAIRFDFELEIILNLFKLATFFLEVKGDIEQNELLIQMKSESLHFLDRKEELIQYYKDNKLDSLMKELSKSELLFLMVGLMNFCRGSQQQDVKETINNVIKDFETHLKKHEINIKISERPFSFIKAFSRNFDEPIQVTFQEINNSATELMREGELSMHLIPDKLAQFNGLQSCRYRMMLSEDESCPTLLLSSLDLCYMPGFSSNLENLESLSLEINHQNQDDLSKETALSISQDLIKLQKLKRLKLYFTSFANFRGHNFKPLAKALSSLSSLQELEIVFGWENECQFTIQHLTKALSKLCELKSLCLIFGYHSTLTDELILSLAEALCKLEKLQDVTLKFFACGSISLTATQQVHDMLIKSKKNPSVIVYPKLLYDLSFLERIFSLD